MQIANIPCWGNYFNGYTCSALCVKTLETSEFPGFTKLLECIICDCFAKSNLTLQKIHLIIPPKHSQPLQVCKVTSVRLPSVLWFSSPDLYTHNPPGPSWRTPKYLHYPSCTLSDAPGLRQWVGSTATGVTRLSLNLTGMCGFEWVL